ncbi:MULTISPECIES: hypothetical protein [Asticcacaulis]|uniref:hypothetical protein n=1 Tax=Asticcacaulis TaxID=76890 RepID=UPI001AE74806|nr:MULTISPECIES: hypothetical protein [Asticcacaulis]MBP2159576.1 hypothetical protein [Asticcacaulis solisilvae]MDR6800597.1 hypothetical protein [Asticcacaulis sp. BE141]
MTKQPANPVLIQLHDDGAHLINEGDDHGALSPACLDLIISHRRACREMLAAMSAADHPGEPTPDEQKRLNETDEAEMMGALRLAYHRLSNGNNADKIAIELHAGEFASRSELLHNLIPIPDSLVITLAEAVTADPARAMAGLRRRNASDFATVEAKISAFQACDQACEASYAAMDKVTGKLRTRMQRRGQITSSNSLPKLQTPSETTGAQPQPRQRQYSFSRQARPHFSVRCSNTATTPRPS